MSWRNAPENFFSAVRGCATTVRKNQPLVPWSNFGGKVCAGTEPWFRGQTLPMSQRHPHRLTLSHWKNLYLSLNLNLCLGLGREQGGGV